jgi:hypothetical protein
MENPPFSRAAVASAVPDLALGLVYLGAWLVPTALTPGVFPTLTLIMLLEFIIIHSSGFMGSVIVSTAQPRAKVTGMLLLGGFYTLFIAAFSISFHTGWPLVSFWALMVNRLSGVLLKQAPDGEERAFLQRSWAVTTLFYLLGAFVTMLPWLPRLGLTRQVAATIHMPSSVSGAWVSEPHRLVAFGFVYFTAVGVSELYHHAWLKLQAPATARSAPQSAS